MVFVLIDIFIVVRIRKRAVIHVADNTQADHKARHQRNVQIQMFVLMIASIAIFLITTLPIGIYKITSPRESNISTSITRISNIWIGLGWFQSLNYAVSLLKAICLRFRTRDLLFRSISTFIVSRRPYSAKNSDSKWDTSVETNKHAWIRSS